MAEAVRGTDEWRALDQAHHLHPFSDAKELAQDGVRIVTRAEGCYFWDSEGNRILDGMAGLWCVNVGYGRRELADAAHQQMMTLPYYNTFFKTATPGSVELAARLTGLAPEGLNHVFYASSGSEATDSIVRIVRHYWNLAGKSKKKNIISREYGYHGSTMAAVSLCGMDFMHAQADLPLPGFHHVQAPYAYRDGGGLDEAAFAKAAAQHLEDKILELGPETVAAFVGEPIQGAGGVIIPPKGYWQEIQRICRKYDVLLVADEVICGFGRTGYWFGSDAFDIEPDLMAVAKGITSGYVPLSAVLVGDRVASLIIEAGGQFAHGFTYSGHPVACAVALANIDLIEGEGLIEKVRKETGPYLAEALPRLLDHPLVGEVRSLGLIGAIEIVRDKEQRLRFDQEGRVGTRCRDLALEHGFVMRAVRDTMVMAPPLIVEPSQIDDLIDGMRRCLDVLLEEYSSEMTA